ncbi:MAG: hypothetical protein AB7S26_09895 [Sandaracinaceae bacterium]
MTWREQRDVIEAPGGAAFDELVADRDALGVCTLAAHEMYAVGAKRYADEARGELFENALGRVRFLMALGFIGSMQLETVERPISLFTSEWYT